MNTDKKCKINQGSCLKTPTITGAVNRESLNTISEQVTVTLNTRSEQVTVTLNTISEQVTDGP